MKDERHPSLASEIEALRETSTYLGAMPARGWDIVLTHGKGPQVGFNLLRSELAARVAPPSRSMCLGAQTQGSIGYLIQHVLGNEIRRLGIRKRVDHTRHADACRCERSGVSALHQAGETVLREPRGRLPPAGGHYEGHRFGCTLTQKEEDPCLLPVA